VVQAKRSWTLMIFEIHPNKQTHPSLKLSLQS